MWWDCSSQWSSRNCKLLLDTTARYQQRVLTVRLNIVCKLHDHVETQFPFALNTHVQCLLKTYKTKNNQKNPLSRIFNYRKTMESCKFTHRKAWEGPLSKMVKTIIWKLGYNLFWIEFYYNMAPWDKCLGCQKLARRLKWALKEEPGCLITVSQSKEPGNHTKYWRLFEMRNGFIRFIL